MFALIFTKLYTYCNNSAMFSNSRPPLVMDPANPLNNLCSSSTFKWEEIVKAAKEVLDSPMLRGVKSDTWN